MAARVASLAVTAILGMIVGVYIGGTTTQDIGPFRAELSLTPSLRGDTSVEIPPLGSLELDSHDGPAHLGVRLESLDEARTRAVVADSGNLEQVGQDAVDQLNHGVRRLAMQTAGAGLLGAMILVFLVFRTSRETAIAGAAALAVFAMTGIGTAATFRPDAIQEPRYEGLLINAPAVVGDARRIANRYEEYRAQLQRLVANVSKLYGTISALPVYEPDKNTTRVLHISDMHLNPAAWSVVRTVADQFDVDVVVDTGDITDWGSEPEASYVNSITNLKVPYVYIRGNHDSVVTAAAVAQAPNAIVLDRGVTTVAGLTFAGIGDPRFTPDKSTDTTDQAERQSVLDSGRRLAAKIDANPKSVDVALVHDPASAQPLAGHLHRREIRWMDAATPSPSASAAPVRNRTLLMVEGSTGGAGLRGLERDEPLPLALSILYFDQERLLQAYDDIRVGGTGLTEVSLERHVITDDKRSGPSPSPSPSSPSPSSPRLSPSP